MDSDSQTIYMVKTPHFEGPFELLLDLVEKRKLFINEISLAQVTEEYLEYIRKAGYAPEEATIFIVIAATLVLMKSRSLLPSLTLSENEEVSIKNLEHRLGLYQYVSEYAPRVRAQFGLARMYLGPERKNVTGSVFAPDPQITKETMHSLITGLIRSIPQAPAPNPEVTMDKVVSLEEMIETLTERVTKEINISFRTLSGMGTKNLNREERVTVIVSFLAMLELVRNGLVDVLQSASFEDIELSRRTPSEHAEDDGFVNDEN